MKIMDGNEACAYVSYNFTEVAGIYPITPASPMAELTDKWSSEGKKNFFGTTVNVVEMESEAGAAGSNEGALRLRRAMESAADAGIYSLPARTAGDGGQTGGSLAAGFPV